MSTLKFYDQASGIWVPVDGAPTKVTYGSTPPAQPFAGQLWADTSSNDLATGFTWTSVTGNTVMKSNYGYLVNGTLTLTLPPTAKVGTIVEVVGVTGLWTIQAGSGQTLWYGSVSGNLQATSAKDSVKLICTTENLVFQVIGAIGTVNI